MGRVNPEVWAALVELAVLAELVVPEEWEELEVPAAEMVLQRCHQVEAGLLRAQEQTDLLPSRLPDLIAETHHPVQQIQIHPVAGAAADLVAAAAEV